MTETGPGSEFDLTEDHEKYAGKVIPDPWDDESQTDWPQNPVNMLEEVNDGSGSGTDGRSSDSSR